MTTPSMDFMRPMGVPPVETRAHAETAHEVPIAPDSAPADAHLAHAMTLVRCAELLRGDAQQQTILAARDEIALALRAVGERRLTADSIAPRPTVTR